MEAYVIVHRPHIISGNKMKEKKTAIQADPDYKNTSGQGAERYSTGVEIALIRLSGLSKKLSGQVDRPTEVIRRTSC